MKWINKIQRFMMGRYGIDDLYSFFLILYIFLFIINLFVDSSILTVIELVIIVIMFYRVLSKNIGVRRRENYYYLRVRKFVLKPINSIKRNYRDRDLYVYKKCKCCKTVLRLPLPSKRGIQVVKCPKCGNKIKFLCFRKEKIEVIRKKKK